MRGYLQILQRYRAYATDGSAQDWIRRIDNKQSRTQRSAISYLPREKETADRGSQRTAGGGRKGLVPHNHEAGQWKLTSPSELHGRARNSPAVPLRKRRGRCYFKILARYHPRGIEEERRVAVRPPIPSAQTAYGGAQPVPLDVCMRDTAQGDTCSITRLDGEGRTDALCVRWIVRNILRQAMPNIMPATSTDAGRPVLARHCNIHRVSCLVRLYTRRMARL
ncbi:hypothetical protein ALC62_12926 [Cyphomyrmex costatus]|uniref:Uncharacterized protein n=1 Tax=Cyphomyrmex costatus TaxID=456900 RepID=A0A195C707_9HYME|nr:hypothetical protein ALC62_12926 [Cyphomyrmex costatus]